MCINKNKINKTSRTTMYKQFTKHQTSCSLPCSKLSFIWVWSSGWKNSKHDFPRSSGGV